MSCLARRQLFCTCSRSVHLCRIGERCCMVARLGWQVNHGRVYSRRLPSVVLYDYGANHAAVFSQINVMENHRVSRYLDGRTLTAIHAILDSVFTEDDRSMGNRAISSELQGVEPVKCPRCQSRFVDVPGDVDRRHYPGDICCAVDFGKRNTSRRVSDTIGPGPGTRGVLDW